MHSGTLQRGCCKLGRLKTLIQTRSLFTLNTSIAFCAKGSLRHLNKALGDDAYVCKEWTQNTSHRNAKILGVADGVGGWHNLGVDPSRLSSGICRELTHQFDEAEQSRGPVPPPGDLLYTAFGNLLERRASFLGGTTLCFAMFDPAGKLTVTNIGDSSMLMFRHGQPVFATPLDDIGLVPRQLVVIPQVSDEMKELGQLGVVQRYENPAWVQKIPRDILSYGIEVQDGDLFVFATDGLYDNLFHHEIQDIVKSFMLDQKFWVEFDNGELQPVRSCDETDLARRLLLEAHSNSLSRDRVSPFAEKLFNSGGPYFSGGKPDDITVIVATANVSEPTQKIAPQMHAETA